MVRTSMTHNDLRIVVRKLRKTIEVDPTRPRILLTERGMVIAGAIAVAPNVRRQYRYHVIAASFIRNDRRVAAVFLARWRLYEDLALFSRRAPDSAGARRAGVPPRYSKMET